MLLLAACGDARHQAQTPPVPAAPTEARALLAVADAAYARAEYDSARALFMSARDRAVVARDTFAEARALTAIGLASWRLGDYTGARASGERALALKLSAGLTHELPKSYNALGLLAHNQGRFAEAVELFTRAERSALEVSDSLALGKALGNRGLVLSDIGDFTGARRGIDALWLIAHARGDATLEGNALGNLGMVDIRAGDPVSAVARLRQALRLHRAIGNAVGEENSLGQLGTAYGAMGEPQLALAYLDSALHIAQRLGLRQQRSDDLQLIAELYGEAGDHARALEHLALAAPLADSMAMQNIQGSIARSQARALFALGDLRSARLHAGLANRFHGKAGARLEQLEDELFVSELARRDGATTEAAASLARARALASALGSRVARMELGLGEARLSELGGQPEQVLRSLDRISGDLAATAGSQEWEAPALAARAYAQLGRLTQASAAGRRAVEAVERVRGNFASGAMRASFSSGRSGIYGDLVLTLLRRGMTSDALLVADAARSRALLEHLAAAGRDSTRHVGTANLVAAELLLRRIDRLLEQIRLTDTSAMRGRTRLADAESGFLSRQLAESRREYESLVRRTDVADWRSSAVGVSHLPSGRTITAALQDGEVLIEYFVTATRLVTFVVRPEGVHALEAPIGEEALLSRVRLAKDLISRRGVPAETSTPVLRQLYATLIQPVRDAGLLSGVRTLVIVPHAALSYLPFAALMEPGSTRYLVQQFEVLTAPSAASFAAVRRAPMPDANGVAAASIFAPCPAQLPGTRLEAIAVGQARPGSSILLGAQATEVALRAALSDVRPVHVATHGVLNMRSPMFSRLALARPAARGDVDPPSDDDGRLEVHELLDLTIRSPLVFLSGCETGAGEAWSTSFARGDDYATLAEAFLFAGARTVISTLWRVDDRGAAAFATMFYAGATRQTAAAALAMAQRALLADGVHGSPYYWAPYIVTGDGRLLGPQKAIPQNRVTASVP